MEHDLRAALAAALPAAGPSRATLKAMDDTGYRADPKNNDMKELFVSLNLGGSDTGVSSVREQGEGATGGGDVSCGTLGVDAHAARGPSASQLLLDYRRERKAAQEAMEREAASRLKAGVGKDAASAAPAGGIGLARATSLGGQELQDVADDERYLRKVQQSKTAAKMSSKQNRRRRQGKAHGTEYEERYQGKVLHKDKRKARMLAMKQMW